MSAAAGGAKVTVAAAERLHLDPATREDVQLRLKSARGHLDGVLRMLETRTRTASTS